MVPPGYRFKPTDQELMQYLEAFVVGKPLEHTFEFIGVEDFYGGREPREIFGTGSGEPVRYYFTELKRISRTGSRFLRVVGDGGTWKGQDRGLSICDKNKTIMGFKKSLRYEGKRSRKEKGVDDHGVWLMKEYSLSNDYLRGKKVVRKDFVLCRIKKVVTKTSRNQFKIGGQNVLEVDTLEAFECDDEVTRGMLSTPLLSENSMLDDKNRHLSYEVSTRTKININNHHHFQEVLVNNQEMDGTIRSCNVIIDYDNNNNQSGQINHHNSETMVNNQEMTSTSSNIIIDYNQSDGLIGATDHHGVIGSNTQMIEGDGILLDDFDDDLLRLLMIEPPVDLILDDFFFGL